MGQFSFLRIIFIVRKVIIMVNVFVSWDVLVFLVIFVLSWVLIIRFGMRRMSYLIFMLFRVQCFIVLDVVVKIMVKFEVVIVQWMGSFMQVRKGMFIVLLLILRRLFVIFVIKLLIGIILQFSLIFLRLILCGFLFFLWQSFMVMRKRIMLNIILSWVVFMQFVVQVLM